MYNIQATKPVLPTYEAYIEEIRDIWETGQMTNNGPKLKKLREQLLERIGCSNLELFVNGHSALLLAIKTLDLKGEIITSPFTFISTTNAIVQSGCTPVFCDIDESYNINCQKIEGLINKNTSAIVAPHIFGIPCDVKEIERIAKRHQLKVIYDGAQAFGTQVDGQDIGQFGDITMFSLHAIKVFNAIEGGIVTYKNELLTPKFEKIRNFGISYESGTNDVEFFGMNAKMDEFRAAMGLLNYNGIDDEISKRKEIAKLYCSLLSEIPGIETFPYSENVSYNCAYFPIRICEEYGKTRDELWNYLSGQGIGTRKLYDKLITDYSAYRKYSHNNETPYADYVKNICLDLPIYGTLSLDDVTIVCNRIKKFANN